MDAGWTVVVRGLLDPWADGSVPSRAYDAGHRTQRRSRALRALVLGGNRYIGRHLVGELAAAGHEVTVINSHPSPLPAGVRRWHADRRVPGVLEEALSPHRDEFDIIYDNTAYQV